MIPVIPNHGHHQYCHPHLLSNTTTTTKDTYDNANKINNPNPWLCSSSSSVWTSDPNHHYKQNNDSNNNCNNEKNKDGPNQDCRDVCRDDSN